MVRELRGEPMMGLVVLGDDDEATRVLVEPMDDPQGGVRRQRPDRLAPQMGDQGV